MKKKVFLISLSFLAILLLIISVSLIYLSFQEDKKNNDNEIIDVDDDDEDVEKKPQEIYFWINVTNKGTQKVIINITLINQTKTEEHIENIISANVTRTIGNLILPYENIDTIVDANVSRTIGNWTLTYGKYLIKYIVKTESGSGFESSIPLNIDENDSNYTLNIFFSDTTQTIRIE